MIGDKIKQSEVRELAEVEARYGRSMPENHQTNFLFYLIYGFDFS